MPTPPTTSPPPSREEILLDYLTTLPYPPYPVQEQALYAWAECQHGVLLSAPTGTGKTLVAEAALYEALRTSSSAYYSTPLIALTDQKFLELRATVARWGFSPDLVGLVTGNRSVNPSAPIKVVVAEVLLNRLLHPEAFDFSSVSAVVMDEFHNFNEPQRGIVWELALALLPTSVRVMLLSATVGAAHEFINYLARTQSRNLTLVEGKERKVPLVPQWIPDELLPDFVERIAQGTETQRRTPALLFCFDRSICWDTAEVLKGKDLFSENQRQPLLDRLESFDFSVGVGNKLRTFLTRGVGIHHAGLLPRYRRIVETLFQEKLLPICVCTETLAAGINLPARSVILSTLVKGPRDKKKLIDPASAQQIFGRAGRPQYDSEGHVFALAHEDDVKIARWQEKYDAIPETDKDPKMMSAKKALLKKKPTRRNYIAYWNPEQFAKLQIAPPAKLASKGRLTWRWLAYLLEASPAIEPIRNTIRSRLMDQTSIEAELKRLTKMLVTLHGLNVVTLSPPPPQAWIDATKPSAPPKPSTGTPDDDEDDSPPSPTPSSTPTSSTPPESASSLAGKLTLGGASLSSTPAAFPKPKPGAAPASTLPQPDPYSPLTATPTDKLKHLTSFRSIHPIYGLYLLDYLGLASDNEIIQILESLLEMPGSVAKLLRVPKPEDFPPPSPGPLTTDIVDPALLTRGIVAQEDLYPPPISDQLDTPPELRKYPIPLAEKMRLLFEADIDHAGGLFITPVWAAGDFLLHGGSFDNFVRSRDLLKQEGLLFKHFLRLVLLTRELQDLTPSGITPEAWRTKLDQFSTPLTNACRAIDPQSTDELLEELTEESP